MRPRHFTVDDNFLAIINDHGEEASMRPRHFTVDDLVKEGQIRRNDRKLQ